MIKVINNSLKYIIETKSVWWYTASARTRARYVRTALGSLWLGISNLLIICVLGFVYGIVFKVDNFKDYYIYLGLGIAVWNTIGVSLNSAPNIFESNSSNLSNTNLNPLFYVCEEWCFQFQTFIQSFVMVIIFLGILDVSLLKNFLIYTPINLLNILLFIFWAPLTICIMAARYCDFYQLIPILTQLVFLISPILYKEKNLGKISIIANLNPIYKVLAFFRDSMIEGRFFFTESLLLLFLNCFMILISLLILEKEKRNLVYYF